MKATNPADHVGLVHDRRPLVPVTKDRHLLRDITNVLTASALLLLEHVTLTGTCYAESQGEIIPIMLQLEDKCSNLMEKDQEKELNVIWPHLEASGA
jgi:hypothetical protein